MQFVSSTINIDPIYVAVSFCLLKQQNQLALQSAHKQVLTPLLIIDCVSTRKRGAFMVLRMAPAVVPDSFWLELGNTKCLFVSWKLQCFANESTHGLAFQSTK